MTTYKCPQYLLKAGFEIGKYGGGCRIEKRRCIKPMAVAMAMTETGKPAVYPIGPQDAGEILRVTKTA